MKTRSTLAGLLCLLTLSVTGQPDLPQRVLQYRPGDWTGYPVLRYVQAAAMGDEWVFFGSTGGVLRYHYYEKKWYPPFTVSDGLENGNIRDLLFDFNSGILWCITDAGISYREPASEYWRNISANYLSGPVTDLGIGEENVWTVSRDQPYRIDPLSGFVAPASLQEMNSDHVRWQDDPGPPVSQRYFMDPEFLWVQDGIQDPFFRTFAITESVQDKFGRQWTGTWGLGVGFIDLNMLTLSFDAAGPCAPDIRAMAWDKDGMWMGGYPDEETPHGITYWDMVSNTWKYYEARFITELLSDAVNAVLFDGTSVWFATEKGLSKYNPDADSWRTYTVFDNLWDDEITCLALNDSILWAGTALGINRIELSGGIIKKIKDTRLAHRTIYQMDADREGLWAGTDRGIYRFDTADNTWRGMDGYSGMILRHITAVAVYGQEVWFGSDDGIQKVDQKTGQWTGFPSMMLPEHGRICTLLPDEKVVWAGTENGLLKYIRNEDRWHLYTVADGLLDNDVRWLLLDGDYIWTGTAQGLTKFYWSAPYRID